MKSTSYIASGVLPIFNWAAFLENTKILILHPLYSTNTCFDIINYYI